MQTELRYERWYVLLSTPLGLGPNSTEVRVEDGTLHVKMGWAFDAHIPGCVDHERRSDRGACFLQGGALLEWSLAGQRVEQRTGDIDDRATGAGESVRAVGEAALVGAQRDRPRRSHRRLHGGQRLAGLRRRNQSRWRRMNSASTTLPVTRDIHGVRPADREYPVKGCRPGRHVGVGVDRTDRRTPRPGHR